MKNFIKQINTVNYILLFLLTTLFSSCFRDRIEIDLNENNQKIVVSAWITDLDEPQFVKLNYTTNYFDNNTVSTIKGAEVKIKNSIADYILEEKEDGIYHLPSDWIADINNNHTLTVIIDGEKYESTSIMKECPKIEDLKIEIEKDDNDNDFISLIFSFDETIGEGDGYFGRDYKYGSLRKDSLSNGSFINDDFVDGIRFEDISLTQKTFEIGDTAILEMFSIGIEASLFLQDIENEKFRGGLFDPPPVNIRTNISNGAVGYFIIGAAKRESIIIK